VKKRTTSGRQIKKPLGWHTSDADELERRRQRAAGERFDIKPLASQGHLFIDYQVRSGTANPYRVEIRSLGQHINSCDCPDHCINGLGSCKHVEAVLQRLNRQGKRRFAREAEKGSPLIEIYLDQRDQKVHLAWPGSIRRRSKAWELLAPFFSDDLILTGDPLEHLPALLRTIDASHGAIRNRIRVSQTLAPWLEKLDRQAQRRQARRHFEAELAAGRTSLDLCKLPLYPYQQEGMLHLAFNGRALLADEMGLGKTVQAIAASELLGRLQGIERVLVVSPASLKGEWQEQIAKFTGMAARIIQGSRAQRLAHYRASGRFFLANYEQVPIDIAEINALLKPDVVILDEAQRIKNWQTKTAIAVKRLQSPYAFVLTGTPLENRIDEIYSIVQFLDPHLFGPLFRFNRDYYVLDEKGRAQGYKNLDRLHEKLRPIMLRRRKEAVEGQLPGRTINNYFVPMHKEQRLRYEEHETRMARLANQARNRPLTKDELERLQRHLACMRMLCDTPYILDTTCRVSPKLDELDRILSEILESGEHKIIIFSEWQRMLELVRELAEKLGLAYAWHTGKVSQPKRREEIRRFKQDPDCRLFLSTDSGSVGLNLQAADTVINLDIPWNPAKLEQRIARAWRKHQKRAVQVINLVTETSIEQRMLGLLEDKRNLAKGVVDGKGPKEMALPSGRAAFLERLDQLTSPARPVPQAESSNPYRALLDRLSREWPDRLARVELHGEGKQGCLLVVADLRDDALHGELERQLRDRFGSEAPRLQLLDQETHRAIGRLIEAGILSAGQSRSQILLGPDTTPEATDDATARRLAEARERLEKARHKQRMAKLLGDGGFVLEALEPMREALAIALKALFRWRIDAGADPTSPQEALDILSSKGLLPQGSVAALDILHTASAPEPAQQLADSQGLFERIAELIDGNY
jgi:hypothetical protein